ncbi:MAG: energy transducer TonB [Leptolyngbya sp. SIOISBB]|nr:energy transducer TonB [Leptolyngbya sp. SIOISBB]
MSKPFLWSATVGEIAALNLVFISPTRAQVRQITHVDICSTDDSLIISLEAPNAEQATILQTDVGNETILDLLITQLGEGLAADQEILTNGIDRVSVEPLDANSVRIRLVGTGGPPTVNISQDETQIVLDVTPPARSISCRRCPQPDYPDAALSDGTEGSVVLSIEFDTAGFVTGASINRSSGNASLDQAALEAALNYEFEVQGYGDQGGRILIEFAFDVE